MLGSFDICAKHTLPFAGNDETSNLCEARINMSIENDFIEAIENLDIDAVRSLIADGVDVNCLDEEGDSGLGLAAAEGNLDMVQLLIGAGANVHHIGSEGFSIMHWVAYNHDDKDVWKLIGGLGLDINARDDEGVTPLGHALLDKNFSFARYAIELGADVNLSDNDHWTPLHHAAAAGDMDAAKILVESGAKKDLKNLDDGIPCQYVPDGQDELLVLVAPEDWIQKSK